jgi:signal peptidase II
MINSKNLDKLIYSTIIGGAIGNFYDRIAFKAVPDFIDLHYNNFHWFVFNLADVFITIGILTLIISEMLKKN